MKPAFRAGLKCVHRLDQPGLSLVGGLLAGLGGWAVMLLTTPAPALAVAGFSGSFDPSTWLVVNTYDQASPPSPSTLSGIASNGNSTLCNTDPFTAPSGVPGPNEVACIESFTTGGDLTLISSVDGPPGGGEIDTTTTTTFRLTNPYASDYEYRRVYLISFQWSFTGGSLDSPTPDGNSSQFLSIRSVGGSVYINGQENYEFVTEVGLAFPPGQQALVYLPMGATLDFTISTNNSNDIATLALTGFDYVEVPAPLPISGATMMFAASRRLRGRLRKPRQSSAILRPSVTAGGLAFGSSRCTLARAAAIHHYSARLGLPMPDRQHPRPFAVASLAIAEPTAAPSPERGC